MKPKSLILGLVVLLVGGLGIYAFVKHRGSASTADNGGADNPPSLVSVQTAALQRLTLHRYVTGYGTVEPAPATADAPAAGAALAATTAGVVTRVNIVEGQSVEQGEVLVELNSGTATFASAQAEVERQKKLFAQQNASLKNLQNAEAQLAALEVVAPLSGTVTKLNVKPGMAVDVTTVVAEVMDLKRLAVSAAIPANQAGELKPGAPLRVQTDPAVTATLSFISPAVSANDGTVAVRALLPADSGLRPGQFVPLRITTAVHTNCLAAPDESVVTDINGQSVIALVNGDEATQTPVQTGFRENAWVEVAGNGLQAGDTVVTVGAYGLPAKTKIQVTK
jgi:RND family efflux transporter MFP subunit